MYVSFYKKYDIYIYIEDLLGPIWSPKVRLQKPPLPVLASEPDHASVLADACGRAA